MKGIRLKLLIYTGILLSLLLTVFYIMQGNIIDRFYIKRSSLNIEEQAQKIGEAMASQDGGAELARQVEYAGGITGGRVSVYDLNGNQIIASGHFMQGKTFPFEYENLKVVLSGKTVRSGEYTGNSRMGVISVGVPAKYNGNTTGAVFIHIPTSPMEEAANTLKKQFIPLFIISLTISVLGALLISRKFTKPIITIKEVSQRIAKGDYSARAKVPGRDEFKELADTINNMGEELEKTEKMRQDFIAGVSHEFRTPLGIIKGYAEAISDGLVKGNEINEYTEAIVDETNRLNKLVNGIMDIAKIESGNLKLNKSQFNFKELIEEIVKSIKIMSGNREITVSGNNANYFGDPEGIGRAILNILSNAVEHTDKDGKIEISIIKNSNLIITIKDNGVGIDEKNIPYIFDKFYRIKDTRGGSGGLGLAISREIIRAHGGDIGVKSKLGKGTEFIITLE